MRGDSAIDQQASRVARRRARAALLTTNDSPVVGTEAIAASTAALQTRRRKPINPKDRLARKCAQLLAQLEKHCPGLLPSGPVPAGEIVEPIEVGNDDLQELLLAAVGVADKRRRNQVVWEQSGSELLVHLRATRVQVVPGIVIVGITVETNESGRVEVAIPFAVGRRDRLAGMVVTTESRPRGPAVIVDRWGDALIAAAWEALLRVVGTLTARAGVDELGNPLLPGAVVADGNRLAVVAQAAHKFEQPTR